MQVDLSGIPAGAKILAARLVLSRTTDGKPTKPNVFVAEPCARPWVEEEANCYEYAAGKFWKAVSGTYHGEDPDFLHQAPHTLGLSRPDETRAAREPILRWRPASP